MRSARRSALVATSIVCSLWSVAAAQPGIPPVISFQGVLTDSAGAARNGTESMMFALHADSTGGSPLWSETQSVPVSDGLFDVYLGDVTAIPDSVFDRIEVYLAVKIAPDDWMTPRRRLASTGWAYRTGCVVLVWYEDSDDDGFGDPGSTTVSCTEPPGFVADNTDCNDGVDTIFPGASEMCNGLDDDCDTVADNGNLDATCDDADACTDDTCSGGGCQYALVTCDDGDLCTDDSCDSGSGCMFVPKECGDTGNECTLFVCNPGTGQCTEQNEQPGTLCTGGQCDGSGVCVPD